MQTSHQLTNRTQSTAETTEVFNGFGYEAVAFRDFGQKIAPYTPDPSKPLLQRKANDRFALIAPPVTQLARMGFDGLKEPTGYGAVVLSASINGVSIGKSWSKKSAYALGTEHAEDALVDYCEYLEGIADGIFQSDSDEEIALAKSLSKKKVLVITGLSASPCTSTECGDEEVATCKKGDMVGCAERLIELAGRDWAIAIQAEHYYQPAIKGGKSASIAAVKAMQAAGIKVKIG